MELFLSLSITFLALAILLYYLSKKNTVFRKIKSAISSLLVLSLLCLVVTVLSIEFVAQVFYFEGLIYLLHLIIYFFTLVFAVKFTSFLFFDFFISQKQSLHYPRLIRDIVVIILYGIGLLLIFQYVFNVKVTVVLASSAVLTVIIGFALQDILGDLFSGITLNFEESLKIGQWIKVGDTEGKIEQFRWRSIKIRTIDNVLLLIPNQIAARKELHIFGLNKNERFALRSEIGVSYKASPDKVIKTIMSVLTSIEMIAQEPQPTIFLKRFDDFSMVYDLKYYITDFSQKNIILGEINRKLWYAFKRNNIEIPFPIRDVYIKKSKESRPVGGDIIHTVKNNEILAAVPEAQLTDLLMDADIDTYGKGEIVINEGEDGSHFFYILSGEVEVMKNGRVVNRLATNDYFGEFSMFTGEKTSADIRTADECRILKISSEKFKETVEINKGMARKLSEAMAKRRSELEEMGQEKMGTQTSITHQSENIFLRIRKYFGV